MSLKILRKPRYSAMLTPYDPSFKKTERNTNKGRRGHRAYEIVT
jgi:hypothetical protein